jgi:hypothetical protein
MLIKFRLWPCKPFKNLTLAIMKALHIQEIRPIEATTRGFLVAPSYWNEGV